MIRLDPFQTIIGIKGATGLLAGGWNLYGECGLGDETPKNGLFYVGKDIKEINGGIFATLALTQAGDLYSCGLNQGGRLGLGDTTSRNVLTFVSSGWDVVRSGGPTLALTADGELYSCGQNDAGQLGLGDNSDRHVLTFVSERSPGDSWVDMWAGHAYIMLLTENGDLYTCGENNFGQLGLGHKNNINTLTYVSSGWKVIRSGWQHTLAIDNTGDLYACGRNAHGQLGLGDAGDATSRSTLQFVASGCKDAAGGGHFTVVLKENGDLYSCGQNNQGQLGLGDTVDRYTLQLISSGWKAVSCGNLHTIAQKESGEVYVWGSNYNHQLCLGSTDNQKKSPTRLTANAKGFAAGGAHCLVLK
jgi:alpha-tubulin suppressor-like RCC1 family protein